MNTAEILLLILGFLSVSISFFLGNREKNNSSEEPESIEEEVFSRDIWTEKEEALVREEITRIFKEERESVVVETTNLLNRRSNEKIMEFDEFSSQVMAKINHNHDEVVFMYNMLTEKEKEWKESAASGKPFTRAQSLEEEEKRMPFTKPEPEPEPEKPPVKKDRAVPQTIAERMMEERLAADRKKPGKPQATGLEQLARHTKETAASTSAEDQKPKQETQAAVIEERSVQEIAEQAAAQDEKPVQQNAIDDQQSLPSNDTLNDQIVRMHRQGKSVMEISKTLNVGQGEVKLTIALYGGNR